MRLVPSYDLYGFPQQLITWMVRQYTCRYMYISYDSTLRAMALGSYHNITHVLTIQKGQHYYTPAVVPMYTLHISHTCINYSIAYPKPQNKRVLLGYCWHFVSLKPSKNHICYTHSIAVQLLCTLLNRTQVYSSITLPRLALSSMTLHVHDAMTQSWNQCHIVNRPFLSHSLDEHIP